MKNQTISTCTACPLYMNQCPLLDHVRKTDVMWVGLSAKRVADPETSVPLDADTNSGRLFAEIEAACSPVRFYKTNLVKCLPLNEQGKLRYPTLSECSACAPNLDFELNLVSPTVVFLLGAKVASFVLRRLELERVEDVANYTAIEYQRKYFVPIPHPSFIAAYRRKTKHEYVTRVQDLIEQLVRRELSET